MELKKKELIIGIALVIAFILICINVTVFADNNAWGSFADKMKNEESDGNLSWGTGNEVNTIPSNETKDGNKVENIPSNQVTNNTANNTPGQLADTGLADTPWLIVGICAVSAIFAYKKIKEYNVD